MRLRCASSVLTCSTIHDARIGALVLRTTGWRPLAAIIVLAERADKLAAVLSPWRSASRRARRAGSASLSKKRARTNNGTRAIVCAIWKMIRLHRDATRRAWSRVGRDFAGSRWLRGCLPPIGPCRSVARSKNASRTGRFQSCDLDLSYQPGLGAVLRKSWLPRRIKPRTPVTPNSVPPPQNKG